MSVEASRRPHFAPILSPCLSQKVGPSLMFPIPRENIKLPFNCSTLDFYRML